MGEKRGKLEEDLAQIASDELIPWRELKDSSVLVTGATGIIGSLLVMALSEASERHGLGVRILALGRDFQKVKNMLEKSCVSFFSHDIRDPLKIDNYVDYIFHCASITRSRDMVSDPSSVIKTSLDGTKNILELAREKQVKSMVYLSSMEVYGNTDPSLEFVTEDIQGFIDLKNPRSCYPMGKRMCECMCNCWHAQYGVPVKTARLAQTFGAGTPMTDSRVFAQFARSAINGKDIVLHTDGGSRGNYCYTVDIVRALLVILLKGMDCEAYNIANPESSMTIREMAELVAGRICEGRISVVIEKPSDIQNRGYAPHTTAKLSAEKLGKLGWKPRYGLEDMYRGMMGDWKKDRDCF
ncbi:MAG: NAD(P)-dependent oxidoreductase [Synergistaceae bacterium]|jgi:nucleoside-diphosphate-sugar epimerase|nr:NAD(P)-dependent oxidoreductase [Synergistaceae bacterium]